MRQRQQGRVRLWSSSLLGLEMQRVWQLQEETVVVLLLAAMCHHTH
jgi:hypothetical protein